MRKQGCELSMLKNGHRLCSILFVVVIFSHNPCFATTIIAIQTSEDVVIAADSKSIIKNNRGEIISVFEESKIWQKNDVLFASSSFVKDLKRGFDANKTIFGLLGNHHPLIQSAKNIETVLSGALNNEWVTVLDEAPQQTRELIQSGKLTTKVLLASYENERSIVIIISFIGIFDKNGRLIIETNIESCPGTCQPNNSLTTFLGASKPYNDTYEYLV